MESNRHNDRCDDDGSTALDAIDDLFGYLMLAREEHWNVWEVLKTIEHDAHGLIKAEEGHRTFIQKTRGAWQKVVDKRWGGENVDELPAGNTLSMLDLLVGSALTCAAP